MSHGVPHVLIEVMLSDPGDAALRVWCHNFFCDLTDKEVNLIKAASEQKELYLLRGKIGYIPTRIYDTLPQAMLDDYWVPDIKKISGYNFWFGIFDREWGYGVGFYYPDTSVLRLGDRIIIKSTYRATTRDIVWYQGMPDLVLMKCQHVVWYWLLDTRGSYVAQRRLVKRLKKKIRTDLNFSAYSLESCLL